MPLKDLLFALRLLNKKITNKDNLIRSGIALLGSMAGIRGCGREKSINHLLFECDYFVSIWFHVLQWLKTCGMLLSDVCMHTLQFGGSHLFRKYISRCFQVI